MAPYKVVVLPSAVDTPIELLVPINSDLDVASLVDLAIKRASKHSLKPLAKSTSTEIRLNSANGYHVDAEDQLAEVLTTDDILFVILSADCSRTKDDVSLPARSNLSKLPTLGTNSTVDFQIRVITPSAAVQHADVRQIPLLKGGQLFSPESKLREIRDAICDHFGLDNLSTPPPRATCNCNLAEQLRQRGNWQKYTCQGHRGSSECEFTLANVSGKCARCSLALTTHLSSTDEEGNCQSYILVRQDLACSHAIHNTCIDNGQGHFHCPQSCQSLQPLHPFTKPTKCTVVSAAHQVDVLDISEPSLLGIMTSLKVHLGEEFEKTHSVHIKGGVCNHDGQFSIFPIVAVCSVSKHEPKSLFPTISPLRQQTLSVSLDLHTAESPITTQFLDQTVGDTGLSDLVVNGVLCIYALSRLTASKTPVKQVGMSGTYTLAKHWEASASQSARGSSAFLSCLRIFAHITSSKDFGEFQTNEVLGLLHQISRFPPAVRAMHMVMSGKTIRSNESAAIIQSFNAVLDTMIPLQLVGNDSGRVLEGSRLLFGLLLTRMRKDKTKTEDSATDTPYLAYIKSYHTADLRDAVLNDPVSNMPMQTKFGLVDRNVYLAHENGGVLGCTPADTVGALAAAPDSRILRVARLSDGEVADVTFYDADTLGSALQSSTFDLTLAEVQKFSIDLKYLATLCDDSAMAVIRPSRLPTATVPSLTLNREGLLAVSLGHAPCSHNMLVFQPVTGAEVELDAPVVEQLIEPIMQARERDGTAVFDMFASSYNRKSTTPSELLMLVVDASYSMDRSSDFTELNDLQNEPVLPSADVGDLVMDEHDSTPVLYPEIRDWFTSYESFPDMVALVHGATTQRSMPTVAKEVVGFLRKLVSRELAHFSREQNRVQIWATNLYLRGHSTSNRIDQLRRHLSGLDLFEKALTDLLVFRARDPGYSPPKMTWIYGEPIPIESSSVNVAIPVDLTGELVIPENLICPISQAVFEDPVRTSDMLGPFDRRAIERWFRVRQSSPLTGLPLNDATLRHDQSLQDEVRRWTLGEDIIAAIQPARKRLRRSPDLLTVRFVTPTGSFHRSLPKGLTTAGLHRVAFRGMRGVHANFSVSLRGNIIIPSDQTINHVGVAQDSELIVHMAAENTDQGVDDMCLIKVYSRNRDFENCAFWVSRHTSATVASILFRYWLDNQHNWRQNNPDRQVWSGLYHGGDGLDFGTRNNTWDKVVNLMNHVQPKPLIRYEKLIPSTADLDIMDTYSDDPDVEEGESFAENVASYKNYRVLKVELDSYISPEELEEQDRRKARIFTRMAVSKQVFNAFINRLIAYNFATTIGLVTFGTRAQISQPMTEVIETFRAAVDRTKTEGDTALWDAIHLAADQLIQRRQQDPNLKCRILALSDGCDTNSIRRPDEVAKALVKAEIVLDSVTIGDEDNLDLRTISYLTGGYAFVPHKLEDAVGICELEPVLSQHERPTIVRPLAHAFLSAESFRLASVHANATPFNRDIFPARKTHPMLESSFVKITALQGRAQTAVPDDSQGIQSGIRSRRLLNEIRDISMNPHPSYDVFVSEANMGFWKVVVAGPAESAYENAAFALYLEMPEEYPRAAPKGRFITPIFHPNISRHGLICHSIFDRNWTADTTVRQVLDTVFGLLLVPEFSEPINTTVILSYYWDEVAFKDEVQKHIAKFATKGRTELGRDILGE